MIIGIDLRCLPADGSPGAGVAHAARELSRTLVRLNPKASWMIYLPTGAVWDEEAEKLPQCEVIRLDSTSGAALRKAYRLAPCKRLFVPSGSVPPGIRAISIPWVHDVAIFRSGDWFPQSALRRLMTTQLFLRGVRRAPCLLAVSEFTKKELVEIARIDPSRIVVTHEGGDSSLAELAQTDLAESKRRARLRLAEIGVTQPFVLWMGTVEPRKNLETVIAAWMRARDHFSRPIDLVIAGRDGWRLGPIHAAMNAAASYPSEGGSRLHRIKAVSDEDRRDLLLGAEVVALPSWHEGFGLVALEGMQAGTAVMVSSEGGMAEIVGEAGIVLPPEDTGAWAGALAGLLNDDISRLALAQAGMSRSQGFTWERASKLAFEALTAEL